MFDPAPVDPIPIPSLHERPMRAPQIPGADRTCGPFMAATRQDAVAVCGQKAHRQIQNRCPVLPSASCRRTWMI